MHTVAPYTTLLRSTKASREGTSGETCSQNQLHGRSGSQQLHNVGAECAAGGAREQPCVRAVEAKRVVPPQRRHPGVDRGAARRFGEKEDARTGQSDLGGGVDSPDPAAETAAPRYDVQVGDRAVKPERQRTRLNSSQSCTTRMPSSA